MIPLLIIPQSSINITVQQLFLQEDTEEGTFNYATFNVCWHLIYIYEFVSHLLASQDDHRIGFSNF